MAFTHPAFCIQRYGGVSRYFTNLIEAMVQEGVEACVFAPVHQNRYLKESSTIHVRGRWVESFPARTTGMMLMLNQCIGSVAMRKWKPSVVHHTYYDVPGCGSVRAPCVLTVYDMIHELFPYPGKWWSKHARERKRAVEQADHVCAISHHTSIDMQRIWGVPKNKITVTHLGVSPLTVSHAGDQVRRVVEQWAKPFFLYVGRRGGYKNFDAVVDAMAMNPRLLKSFDLVMFGGPVPTVEDRQRWGRSGLAENSLRYLTGDDGALAELYRSATALVYPSLYEGFGLPPLEAMAYDCPVCASSASSIPEVVGDAGVYFDPTSSGDLSRAMESIAYDEGLSATLIEKGRDQVKRFTWAVCAERTAAVYRMLAE